jgi:hypothetical protein
MEAALFRDKLTLRQQGSESVESWVPNPDSSLSVKEPGLIDACEHVLVRLKAETPIKAGDISIGYQQNPPHGQVSQKRIHQDCAYTLPLEFRSNDHVVYRGVILAVAECSRRSCQSGAAGGETNDSTVLECPTDLVAFTSTQVGRLE